MKLYKNNLKIFKFVMKTTIMCHLHTSKTLYENIDLNLALRNQL